MPDRRIPPTRIQQIYTWLLEIHEEWPALKGKIFQIGGRVDALETAVYQGRKHRAKQTPSEALGDKFGELTNSGLHVIVPVEERQVEMQKLFAHEKMIEKAAIVDRWKMLGWRVIQAIIVASALALFWTVIHVLMKEAPNAK
jgi:hypothetical protein